VSGGWERDFVDYVGARSHVLRNTAYLLCGDWHRAEDLTQIALAKLYLAWRRIGHQDSVDGYARQVLVRTFLDERRRPWRREHVAAELTDRPAPADPVDDRVDLLAALRRLPRTQRAVVVLRYWADLSVAETAAALGVREGTVKSASSRGLSVLREVLQGSRPGEPVPDPAWTRE
jgi:RNA polymerase sigma-70 factor (sigma-E family)